MVNGRRLKKGVKYGLVLSLLVCTLSFFFLSSVAFYVILFLVVFFNCVYYLPKIGIGRFTESTGGGMQPPFQC